MQNHRVLFVLLSVFVIVYIVSTFLLTKNANSYSSKQGEIFDTSELKTNELVSHQKEPKEKSKNNYAFSADPVVELSVITYKYFGCKTYFSEKNNQNSINWHKQIKSEKTLEHHTRMINDCVDINKSHPEYKLDNNINYFFGEYDGLNATSVLGHLIKYSKLTNNETLFYFETVANDFPDFILQSFFKAHRYRKEIIIPELKQVLQTQSDLYTRNISITALAYLACSIGADCGATSLMMYSRCRSNESFCVNDFMDLYLLLSDGVKADTQLTLGYFKKLYKIE